MVKAWQWDFVFPHVLPDEAISFSLELNALGLFQKRIQQQVMDECEPLCVTTDDWQWLTTQLFDTLYEMITNALKALKVNWRLRCQCRLYRNESHHASWTVILQPTPEQIGEQMNQLIHKVLALADLGNESSPLFQVTSRLMDSWDKNLLCMPQYLCK